jgi:hypothetical protein
MSIMLPGIKMLLLATHPQPQNQRNICTILEQVHTLLITRLTMSPEADLPI